MGIYIHVGYMHNGVNKRHVGNIEGSATFGMYLKDSENSVLQDLSSQSA